MKNKSNRFTGLGFQFLSDFELMDELARASSRRPRRDRRSGEPSFEEMLILEEMGRRGVLRQYRKPDGSVVESFGIGLGGGSHLFDDCELCREMASYEEIPFVEPQKH